MEKISIAYTKTNIFVHLSKYFTAPTKYIIFTDSRQLCSKNLNAYYIFSICFYSISILLTWIYGYLSKSKKKLKTLNIFVLKNNNTDRMGDTFY